MTMRLVTGLALAAVALGALAGCRAASSADPSPARTPDVTSSPLPTAGARPEQQTQGIDIRYLDRDGTVKTLRAKDFKH